MRQSCVATRNPATLAGLGPGFPQRDEPLLAAASEVTLEDFEESRQTSAADPIQPATGLGVPKAPLTPTLFVRWAS